MYFISHDMSCNKNFSQKGKGGCKKGLWDHHRSTGGFLRSNVYRTVYFKWSIESVKDLKATVQWITLSAEAWITTISVPRVGRKSKARKKRTRMNLTMNLQEQPEPATGPWKYLKIVAERTWSKLWRQLRHAWAIALVVLRPFCPLRDAAAPGNRVDTAHQKSTADAISYVYV